MAKMYFDWRTDYLFFCLSIFRVLAVLWYPSICTALKGDSFLQVKAVGMKAALLLQGFKATLQGTKAPDGPPGCSIERLYSFMSTQAFYLSASNRNTRETECPSV